MEFVIVSGRSGSGKSTALHILEDMGFYCVDNLPLSLLGALCQQFSVGPQRNSLPRVAVSVDARNLTGDSPNLSLLLDQLNRQGIAPKTLYFDAGDQIIFKRFSETRRKHPLTGPTCSLAEALEDESRLLASIAAIATPIDTSQMSIHELRDFLRNEIEGTKPNTMAILFQSFGFKRGIPAETDLIFDTRCLPNPYWVKELRLHSGLEQPVKDYLDGQKDFQEMHQDITAFLERWLPKYQKNNRPYITIGIGCTGGHHRSVYMSEKLAQTFGDKFGTIQVRHRDL